jgi:iron only hydrogenase large subunit-like protein
MPSLQVGEVQIQRRSVTNNTLNNINDPIKISLHDCLACSGCVTTAETVLLEQQSISQFTDTLKRGSAFVVVTLSLQSVASISEKYKLCPESVIRKLASIFRSQGAQAVFDIQTACDLALIENYAEFKRRLQSQENLPMMTSACPGWVCYVEKSHPHLLPFLSTVKSPQGIMGTLLKQYWAPSRGKSAKDMYHVTVMPCYDKKLESVREELMMGDIPETDCVLTTGELESWLERLGISILDVPEIDVDDLVHAETYQDRDVDMMAADGDADFHCVQNLLPESGRNVESGGYLDHVYRLMSSQYNLQLNVDDISLQFGRNADIKESTLTLDHDAINFAIINGFRNIQGLVRRIKKRSCKYHYVEVMACPSGCINGGGQLSVSSDRSYALSDMKDRVAFLRRLSHKDHHTSQQCTLIYQHWIHGAPGSLEAQHVFATSFRERKMISGASPADW